MKSEMAPCTELKVSHMVNARMIRSKVLLAVIVQDCSLFLHFFTQDKLKLDKTSLIYHQARSRADSLQVTGDHLVKGENIQGTDP